MQYIWVILLFLPSTLSQYTERFRLVVPEAPVFSVSGSDVVLSCSVRELYDQNIINAVDLTVTWSRSDLNDSLVHLYGNHKDPNTDQIPSYRGRTAVFKEELKNGNASLKLSNVQPSDEGEYRCRVDSTSWRSDKTFKLSVEVMGSEPVITVEKYESEKFSLLCESKGWYPKPELQWRNCKDKLTAETETQAVADLFNVKSRITVEKIDLYFCSVTRRHHVKEGLIDAQTLYERASSEARKKRNAVGITIGVILLVVVLAGIFCLICYIKFLLNSDKDGRLQHRYLFPCLWWYVKRTLLKSEEDLEEFNLRKFDPSDRGVQKLKKVIASSKKAVLEDCNLSEESCAVLASVLISGNSKLIELNLSQNRRLEDSGVMHLCLGLKHENCKLQKLRLENCFLREESCAYLASVLRSGNSKLIELNLSQNTGLKDSGVKYLGEGLKHENCKLQKLRLDFCFLREESCAYLASVLKSKNSKLIELNLSQNTGLKDSGVKNLCDGLKHENCKLQILRLEFCGLTGKSCEFLAEVLKSENSKLIELTLSKNKIQNSGVEKLCDGLKDKNCKLKILRLAECSVMVKGFTALYSALKENPSSPLEELDLSRNEIEVSEQELLPELNDTLPNLKVKLDECCITYVVNAAPASENQDLSSNDQKESELELLTGDTCV